MNKRRNKFTNEMNTLSRRDFFKTTGLSLGTALMTHTVAGQALDLVTGTPATERLVFVFLRGGADALSILAPVKHALAPGETNAVKNKLRLQYEALRPTLQIPHRALLTLANSENLGLHPAAGPLKALYDQNRLNFVMNVGSFNPTTSHFSQQDSIEYSGGKPGCPKGFLARALRGIAENKKSEAMAGLSASANLAKSLLGTAGTVSISNLNANHLHANHEEKVSGTSLFSRIELMFKPSEASYLRTQGIRAMAALETMTTLPTVQYSNSEHYNGMPGFETALSLMVADPLLRFTTIDVGGWDDHVRQGTMDGAFHDRLEKLSRALNTFVKDLNRNGLLPNTTVVVMSEFGRRAKENSGGGTDHGRGGVAMILGENLPQQVVQDHFSLSNLENGNLKVLVDYKQIFAEILQKKFHLPNLIADATVNGVVQGAVFPNLDKKFKKVLG